MKRALLLLIFTIFGISATTFGQLFQARFVTSAYSWQRLDAAKQKENHLFAFQGAHVMIGTKDVTVRTYLQGFNDFAGPEKNDPKLKLYSFSVTVRNLLDMITVQAGRQFIFAGAGRGLVDGISASVRPMGNSVVIKGFYGILAPTDRSLELNDSKNILAGAEIRGSVLPSLSVSASFATKQYTQDGYRKLRTADALLNTEAFSFSPTDRTENIVSADARYDVGEVGDVYARYDHNLTMKHMERLNAFGRFRIMEDLSITAEYLQREPRVSYQSIFSVFSYSTIQDMSAGIEYGFLKGWHAVASVGSISYGDESSQRLTLGVNGDYVSASLSTNTSDRSTLDAASLNAGYPLFDRLVTPTLVVSYAHYKLDAQAPTNDAISVAGGLAVRPLPLLLIDAQLQWMNNKVYASDMRIFLRISYAISHRLSLF